MNAFTTGLIAIVRDFGAAWDRLDLAAITAMLHDDIRYANGARPVLHGRESVSDYLRSALAPVHACEWIFRAIAASGNEVLTERIDVLHIGNTEVRLPVMGVFAIVDGRIHEWRDYFDLAAYRAQWPREEIR